jgi:hypothetical protein
MMHKKAKKPSYKAIRASSEKERFIFRHYEFVVTTSLIAIIALLIFMMKMGKPSQVGFLIASAPLLGWGLHSRSSDERSYDVVIDDKQV